MASAVLASSNEPHWSERKLCMSEFTPNSTTNNPHLYGRINPNPNPTHYSFNPGVRAGSNFSVATKRIHESSTRPQRRHFNDPSPRSVPPLPGGLIHRNDSFHREYVTFNLGSYSRREIKELKQLLIFDLERVQGVLKKLETLEFESRASFHGLQRGEAPESPSESPSPPQLLQQPRLQGYQPGMDVLHENPAPNGVGHHFQSSEPCGVKNKGKNKLSGKKRSFTVNPEGDHERKVAKLDGVAVSMMRRCAQILTKLMKHKFGWVFDTPVDTKGLGLHDYHMIIRQPMDLGTVKSRLDRYQYETPLDFASDVRLTFKNAMIYNPKGQDVHAIAELLLKNFDDMFTAAYQKYEAENKKFVASQKNVRAQPERIVALRSPEPMLIAKNSDMGCLLSTSLDPPHLPSLSNSVHISSPPVSAPAEKRSLHPFVPPKSGKLPKPKAKDPNKRQMTFEEKARLGIELQNLPQDKMDHMMQILRRRNSSVSTEGDEIELDIEALDNETLWELDRFVGYQKKALSKMKRQGLIAGASRENVVADALGENVSNFPGNVPMPNPVVHKDKKDEAGEEDVDIGEESPINNFPPVKIEKDVSRSSSSRSTSSSSDSSSSDSDSGSSCGSDSDEDSVQLQEVSKM